MKPSRDRIFTFTKLSDKEAKSLRILGLIRKKGVISRTDISRLTGINIVSTCSYIKNYIDGKIVLERGYDVSTGGRKPELVELDTKDSCVIGLDVGQTALKGVMTDLALNVIKKTSASWEKSDDGSRDAKVIAAIKELSQSAPAAVNGIRAIGAAMSDSGFSELPERVEKEFGVNVFGGDAVSSAAAAEKYLNLGIASDNFLFIFSGLGEGVMMKGDELFDKTYSEEAAYLRPWNEAIGIVGLAKQEVAKGIGTLIVDLAKADTAAITEDIIIAAAKQNDETAMSVLQTAASNLGIRIAYLVNLFGLETVVIGASMAKGGEPILGEIRTVVKKMASKKQADIVKIIPAVMGEDAVSIGAAALTLREIFLRA